jgi:hypothetical protein
LAAARGGWSASTGTSTNGWWAGNGNIDSNIDRITYATDTATASVRGTLIASNYGMYATTDSTTFGWFAGGSSSPSYLGVTTIQRITYATDTASTTLRGSLTQTQSRLAATTNMNYGWWGGGFNGVSTYYSTVSRLTYATDTANASSRGPLGGAVYTLSGVSGIA